MNCDGVSDLLSAYLDGELVPGELLRVEQHLRRCHACADSVTSLRQTIALVASLDEVDVPAAFHAKLHSRLVAMGSPVAARHKSTAASWQRNVRTWAIPAVAAAAALAFAWSNTPPGQLPGLTVASYMSNPAPEVAVAGEPAKSGGPVQHEDPATPPVKTQGPGINPITGGTVPPVIPPAPLVATVDPPKGTTGIGPGTGGNVVVDPGTVTAPATTALTPVYSYTTTIVIATDNSDKLVQSLKQPSWNPVVTTEGVLILKVASDSYAPTVEAVTKLLVGSTVAVSPLRTDRASQIQQLTTELKARQIELTNFAASDPGVQDDEYTTRFNEKQKIVTDISDKLRMVQDEVSFGRINVQFKPAH
jgi:hypothetical protein